MGASVVPDPFAQGASSTDVPDPFAAPYDVMGSLRPRLATPAEAAKAKVLAPRKGPAVMADATRQPDPFAKNTGKELPQPLKAISDVLIQPIADQPVTSALMGVGIPAASALSPLLGLAAAAPVLKSAAETEGGYLGQKAAELTLPPDVRTLAEHDPTRIPGWNAAVLAGSLALPPLLHAGYKAVVPDVGNAVAQGFGDVAKEAKGTVPEDIIPEAVKNQRFADMLQQGAEDAGTAPKRGVLPSLSPEEQSVADFARQLEQGAKEAPPKKVVPVEGLTDPAEQVAQDAIQRYYQEAGYGRRPGAGEPKAPISPEAQAIADLAANAVETRPTEAVPDPFADLGTKTVGELPKYPEGFTMGDTEPRIPEAAPIPKRGNPEPPSTFVTPEVERVLGEEPIPRAQGPAQPPFRGAVLKDGIWMADRRTGAPTEASPTGMEIPLRRSTDHPLLNPRTFDQAPAIQEQLASAVADLQRAGVQKEYVPVAEGMQRVTQSGRQMLRDLGIDPFQLDPNKVRNLSGEQIVAMKRLATTAMDQVAALSKELERPGLSDTERSTLEGLYANAKQARDNVLENVMVASGQKGRDLNFLKQIANRDLDPDTWVHQARRIAGDQPLSDRAIATIRRLAKEAADACA